MYVPRFRRISDVLKEITEADPQTVISRNLIVEWLNAGKITAMKLGNAWLINIDELYAFMKGEL